MAPRGLLNVFGAIFPASGGAGPGSAAPDTTGKVYTVSGLKPGSSAILYANGTQASTTTVDGTGKATWTLANKPAIGTVMTYDGTVTGSAGTVPNPTPVPAFTVQPSISPNSGTVGQVFTVVDGTITNGSVSARQWSLNGTAISGATGASYTSTAAGSLTCTITATGSGGTASATSAAATVTTAPVALSISGANGTANVGDTTSFTPTISGGTAPYAVTATGLPPGRSITNVATGLTTGAYTTAGSYSATYTVTDNAGATASFTRTVTVSAASSSTPPGFDLLLGTDGQSLTGADAQDLYGVAA